MVQHEFSNYICVFKCNARHGTHPPISIDTVQTLTTNRANFDYKYPCKL